MRAEASANVSGAGAVSIWRSPCRIHLTLAYASARLFVPSGTCLRTRTPFSVMIPFQDHSCVVSFQIRVPCPRSRRAFGGEWRSGLPARSSIVTRVRLALGMVGTAVLLNPRHALRQAEQRPTPAAELRRWQPLRAKPVEPREGDAKRVRCALAPEILGVR